MRLCLFFQLFCFLWIEKQTFKNEFVIWKDSCDQVSLNRIQDVIFELHYPYQREGERQRQTEREKPAEMEKKASHSTGRGVWMT